MAVGKTNVVTGGGGSGATVMDVVATNAYKGSRCFVDLNSPTKRARAGRGETVAIHTANLSREYEGFVEVSDDTILLYSGRKVAVVQFSSVFEDMPTSFTVNEVEIPDLYYDVVTPGLFGDAYFVNGSGGGITVHQVAVSGGTARVSRSIFVANDEPHTDITRAQMASDLGMGKIAVTVDRNYEEPGLPGLIPMGTALFVLDLNSEKVIKRVENKNIDYGSKGNIYDIYRGANQTYSRVERKTWNDAKGEFDQPMSIELAETNAESRPNIHISPSGYVCISSWKNYGSKRVFTVQSSSGLATHIDFGESKQGRIVEVSNSQFTNPSTSPVIAAKDFPMGSFAENQKMVLGIYDGMFLVLENYVGPRLALYVALEQYPPQNGIFLETNLTENATVKALVFTGEE